jgi:dimethylhistidine N-methyltransferase
MCRSLQTEFPQIQVMPVAADFTNGFVVPVPSSPAARNVIYFPGSTIGNFVRNDALSLLAGMADKAGVDGGVLIGVDLDKDRDILHEAYNDSQGVTADFNLNVLRRINDELGGGFDLDYFRYEAVFNEDLSCIEMNLISTCRQTVNVCKYSFSFEEGESVLTEYSHKYTVESFGQMADEVGLAVKNVWTDVNDMFAVMYLERV